MFLARVARVWKHYFAWHRPVDGSDIIRDVQVEVWVIVLKVNSPNRHTVQCDVCHDSGGIKGRYDVERNN